MPDTFLNIGGNSIRIPTRKITMDNDLPLRVPSFLPPTEEEFKQRLFTRIAQLSQAKNSAYKERNQVLALAAKLAIEVGCRVGLSYDCSEHWDDEWRNTILIDLPSGQVSWHIHESELALFSFLNQYLGSWDGHSTKEKYQRVEKATKMNFCGF
jgi:hypothetical protein